jgi:DNA replication and repair protein RecF
VRVESVEIRGLRCLADVAFELPAGGAWLVGPNGAGKTSVLEALCLLGFGRSFRGRVADGLVQRGQEAIEVVARWVDDAGRPHTSGLRHRGEAWEGRLDGAAVGSLSELAAPFPVLCFHPASSQLVTGPAEDRRRALDWVAFHVEPRFAEHARRYARALKQRNALLRTGASDSEFDGWEREMGQAAAAVQAQRLASLSVWRPALERVWPHLGGGLPPPRLALRAGWRVDEADLADLLLLNRARDRELGYTTVGPQRADLDLGAPCGVETGQLSRGQAKLVALALQLAQADGLLAWSGVRSLLLLDDLQAELDDARQQAVLADVQARGYQAVVTGTHLCAERRALTPGWAVFHVEHGHVAAATVV